MLNWLLTPLKQTPDCVNNYLPEKEPWIWFYSGEKKMNNFLLTWYDVLYFSNVIVIKPFLLRFGHSGHQWLQTWKLMVCLYKLKEIKILKLKRGWRRTDNNIPCNGLEEQINDQACYWWTFWCYLVLYWELDETKKILINTSYSTFNVLCKWLCTADKWVARGLFTQVYKN